jgi:hypothetical protein
MIKFCSNPTHSISKTIGFSLFSILSGVAFAAGPNLLQNGSFENGNFGLGLTSTPGWTVPYGTIDIMGPTFQQSGGDIAPGEGIRYAELVGTPGTSAIEQSIATTVGQTYLVSGLLSRHLGIAGGTAKMQVRINGSLLQEFQNNAPISNASFNWQSFSTTFVASTSLTTIRFADNTNLYAFGGASVDGLKVQAVPEPATMTVMVLGAAAVLRRRKRA